ncbi:hypothetical protein RND71_008131 [Anisodus tanguticus]|uniref:J domain-containing protein n=1 Tax=Anisodus tanguticus TaxID=243964 RepID=A0AAE1SMV1_9SOLA|nr:hypothetical protein RND71_008131 [Anisodus tanguticus]
MNENEVEADELKVTIDSNEDEALRCISIAKEAIALGNKQRALKFIGIACRLNKNLAVDDLLAARENLDSSIRDTSNEVKNDVASVKNEAGDVKTYREEHIELIRRIKSKKDYYEILGLEKSCSVEEIKKAYRKVSLKVHPDKNKAPGSEDAFKKVAKAFKCLSDDGSRRRYDMTGYADEFVYSQHQHNVSGVRRRRTSMSIVLMSLILMRFSDRSSDKMMTCLGQLMFTGREVLVLS